MAEISTTQIPGFFVNQPEIVTERLLLRRLRPEDASELFEFCSRDIVTKYVIFETHRTLADTEAFIARALAGTPLDFGVVWAIVWRASGKVIGTIGLHRLDASLLKLEAGYALHDEFWNQGIVTEALKAVIGEVFSHTPIKRIEALCIAEHAASAKVMEKAGMQYEGTLRQWTIIKNAVQDMKIYSIIRDDYERTNNN